jgi:hypothetical protein
LDGDWSGRKPPKKDDVVNGPNPAPGNGERQRTFNQNFGCPSDEQMGAMKRLGVDDGIVNNAQFPSVGQIDVQARPVGHDLNA